MTAKTTSQTQQKLMTTLLEEANKAQVRAIDETATMMKSSLGLMHEMVLSSQKLTLGAVERAVAFGSNVLND